LWRSVSNNNLDILKVNSNLKEFLLLFGIEPFAQIFLSLYNNIKNVINEFFPFFIDPLKAELNPICHSLILLGDLTFMGPCIVSIFQYMSNKIQRYTVYLYLKTALHVSGGTSTHYQERIQLYLQHLVFVTPLLLSAAIVEELELV
jgi:hypothetical protein